MRKLALMEVSFYADGQIIPTHYAEHMKDRPGRIDRILKIEGEPKYTMKYVCRCGENVLTFLFKDYIWYIAEDSTHFDEYRKSCLDSFV